MVSAGAYSQAVQQLKTKFIDKKAKIVTAYSEVLALDGTACDSARARRRPEVEECMQEHDDLVLEAVQSFDCLGISGEHSSARECLLAPEVAFNVDLITAKLDAKLDDST